MAPRQALTDAVACDGVDVAAVAGAVVEALLAPGHCGGHGYAWKEQR